MAQEVTAILVSVTGLVVLLMLCFNYATISNSDSGFYAYGKLRKINPTMKGMYASITRNYRTRPQKTMSGILALRGNFGAPPESWVREYYAKFAPQRAALLNETDLSYGTLYSIVVPEVFCPNLVRVGYVLDGGKYVCNPRVLSGNCSIYSLGIDNEISFDKAMQEFNNFTCKIYGYDIAASSNDTLLEYEKINGEIVKVELAPETNPASNKYFLGDLVKRNNDTSIEILKVDIEGQEHDSLVPFLEKYEVCQVRWYKFQYSPLIRTTTPNQIRGVEEVDNETVDADLAKMKKKRRKPLMEPNRGLPLLFL